MDIKRVIYVEDSISKYMDISTFLKKQGIRNVDWLKNAEDALSSIEESYNKSEPYDLLISDMHFDFYGNDDKEAGEKLVKLLREKGYKIPVVFCSSQNWGMDDCLGNIFYNPYRDWEIEAEELIRKIRKL